MAVVKMKKFRLIGLSSEKQKITSALLRSGSVQLKPTEEIDLTVRGLDSKGLDEAVSVYSRTVIALDFLAAQKKTAQSLIKSGAFEKDLLPEEKKTLISVREEVSAEDFEKVALESRELLSVCKTLEEISTEKNEIKARLTAAKTLQTGLTPYREFTLKFSDIKETKHVRFLLGLCKSAKNTKKDAEILAEKYGAEVSLLPVKNVKGKLTEYILFVAAELSVLQALEAELAPFGYTACPYSFDCTAKEKLESVRQEICELSARNEELTKKAIKYLPYVRSLRLLSDNYRFRMEMIRADADFAKTAQTFILESFVPEPDVKRVEKALSKATENIVLTFEDVEEKDLPPTLLKNNGLVAPYESITNTYSPPSYYETDPNLAVAIFYFIFFGIMLGDAGYGLVLALLTFTVAKFCKMERGMKNLLLIFGMGGLSAVVWGLLFGGIFSIDSIEPLWFNPLDNPIEMLALCFALGFLHILVGMGYQAHDQIKNKHFADAVYDVFSWYIVFIGAGLTVLSLIVVEQLPVFVGISVLAAGIAILMFGGAIRAKGFFGRIIGAVKPLYGIVNYFSDVMSYSRLFGLSLASSVIGLVFNTLAGVLTGMIPVLGYILAVIVLILGHTLNLLIGLLGVYVHDSRLQYIEFFGRFYHGGGRQFAPLGLNLKYVTIKHQEV